MSNPAIPDMVHAIIKVKSKNIKRFPCHVNRASGIGHFVPELKGCVRRGVYERTHWKEKELISGETQLVFDEGKMQEQRVMRDLSEAGVELIEQQCTIDDEELGEPGAMITGHLDGVLPLAEEAGVATKIIPVDIKSMNPNIFAQCRTFDDFDKWPWTRGYKAQIQLYIKAKKVTHGIFILKDKSNGKLRQIVVPFDPVIYGATIRTAHEINKHIKDETKPERINDREICKKCPFRLTCLPDVNFDALRIADDPSLEEKIDRYLQLKENSLECDKLYKELIAPRMKATANAGSLNVLLGKYHLTGKTSTNGSFRPKIEVV